MRRSKRKHNKIINKKIIISIIVFIALISIAAFNIFYNFGTCMTWNGIVFKDGRELMEYIGAERDNTITFKGQNGEYKYEFRELGILTDLTGGGMYPEIKKEGRKHFIKSLFGKKTEFKKEITYKTSKFEEVLNNNILPNETKEKVDSTYEIDEQSKKVNIKNGHKGYTIDVEALKKTLKEEIQNFDRDNIDIELKIEEISFETIDVLEINEKVKTDPVNMKIYDDGSITKIIYPQNGIGLDGKARDEIFYSNEQEDLEYTVPISSIEPEIKNVDLSPLFTTVMGEHTTTYATGDIGRSNNVELSAKFINEIILNPGDIFSYTDLVGPTTVEKGYKTANVFVNGKVEKGLGGGICQTSSTLYMATLYADLEIVERHNHSLPVSYVPMAMDATVATGILDFKFKNNYNFPVKISAIGNNGKLTIKILGEEKIKDVTLYNKFISNNGNYTTYSLYKDVKINDNLIENAVKINTSTYKN